MARTREHVTPADIAAKNASVIRPPWPTDGSMLKDVNDGDTVVNPPQSWLDARAARANQRPTAATPLRLSDRDGIPPATFHDGAGTRVPLEAERGESSIEVTTDMLNAPERFAEARGAAAIFVDNALYFLGLDSVEGVPADQLQADQLALAHNILEGSPLASFQGEPLQIVEEAQLALQSTQEALALVDDTMIQAAVVVADHLNHAITTVNEEIAYVSTDDQPATLTADYIHQAQQLIALTEAGKQLLREDSPLSPADREALTAELAELAHQPGYSDSPELLLTATGYFARETHQDAMTPSQIDAVTNNLYASYPLEEPDRGLLDRLYAQYRAFGGTPWNASEQTLARLGELTDAQRQEIAESLHLQPEDLGPDGIIARDIAFKPELIPYTEALLSWAVQPEVTQDLVVANRSSRTPKPSNDLDQTLYPIRRTLSIAEQMVTYMQTYLQDREGTPKQLTITTPDGVQGQNKILTVQEVGRALGKLAEALDLPSPKYRVWQAAALRALQVELQVIQEQLPLRLPEVIIAHVGEQQTPRRVSQTDMVIYALAELDEAQRSQEITVQLPETLPAPEGYSTYRAIELLRYGERHAEELAPVLGLEHGQQVKTGLGSFILTIERFATKGRVTDPHMITLLNGLQAMRDEARRTIEEEGMWADYELDHREPHATTLLNYDDPDNQDAPRPRYSEGVAAIEFERAEMSSEEVARAADVRGLELADTMQRFDYGELDTEWPAGELEAQQTPPATRVEHPQTINVAAIGQGLEQAAQTIAYQRLISPDAQQYAAVDPRTLEFISTISQMVAHTPGWNETLSQHLARITPTGNDPIGFYTAQVHRAQALLTAVPFIRGDKTLPLIMRTNLAYACQTYLAQMGQPDAPLENALELASTGLTLTSLARVESTPPAARQDTTSPTPRRRYAPGHARVLQMLWNEWQNRHINV